MVIIYGIPDTVRQLLKKPLIEKNRNSSLARGTIGELTVLYKLSELDDNYHVFCDVKIRLDRNVRHRGGPLRNARIDFVVVSKRGVFCIEVKNWSDEYLSKELVRQKKYGGFLPHMQAERNGMVLYLELSGFLFFLERRNQGVYPNVINVLLATHGNMKYDPDYRVNVKDLSNINTFIQNRPEKSSDKVVQEIVEDLKVMYLKRRRRNML